MPKKVTMEEFNELLKTDKLIFADLFATWCGPCQMMLPIIDEIAEDFKDNDKIEMIKVDIDETPQIAAQFSVMSVPTFLFIKDGEAVDRTTGATAKDVLTEKINSLLKKK